MEDAENIEIMGKSWAKEMIGVKGKDEGVKGKDERGKREKGLMLKD